MENAAQLSGYGFENCVARLANVFSVLGESGGLPYIPAESA